MHIAHMTVAWPPLRMAEIMGLQESVIIQQRIVEKLAALDGSEEIIHEWPHRFLAPNALYYYYFTFYYMSFLVWLTIYSDGVAPRHALCIHSKSTPQHDNSPFWGYKSDAAPWIFVCLCRRNFNASSLQCGMTANWAQPTNQILIFLNATTTLARHNNSLI